jgi:hypothetical protein
LPSSAGWLKPHSRTRWCARKPFSCVDDVSDMTQRRTKNDECGYSRSVEGAPSSVAWKKFNGSRRRGRAGFRTALSRARPATVQAAAAAAAKRVGVLVATGVPLALAC